MKIEKVKIENFKSLKNIDLMLANLTLLTGVNSSGKSSFIQTLLFLKQNKNIKKVEEINNIKDIAYQNIKEGDLINITIFSNESNFKISFRDVLVENDFARDDSKINLFSNRFQYLHTDRTSPKELYQMSSNEIKNNSIGQKGEFTAHYLDTNKYNKIEISKLKHPTAKTDRLIENVSLWLNEISNGIEISTKIHSSQYISLGYKYNYGNNQTDTFTPLNVGFGVTYVLPIIVSVLKAKSGDLLIIENPESDLHPAAQSKIAELCAIASANGVQIIIETHSDHFLNGIRVATKKGILKPESSQVYYFRKERDELETKIDVINIDETGGIDNYPKGFFDQFDNDLDRLITW